MHIITHTYLHYTHASIHTSVLTIIHVQTNASYKRLCLIKQSTVSLISTGVCLRAVWTAVNRQKNGIDIQTDGHTAKYHTVLKR